MQNLQLEPPANLDQQPGVGLADPGRGESLGHDNLRRQAVRGGVIVMASRLLTQLFVWASTLLVMRFLSPSDVGIMTWGMVFVGLADLLAEAGVGRALIQKPELTTRDLNEGFSLTLFFSTLAYALLFAIAGPIEQQLTIGGFAFFLQILALHLFLIPIRAIPLALLDRHMRMGKQSLIHVGSAVIQAGLVLALAISGLGYWSQVIGTLIGRGLEAIALLWVSGYRPRLAMLGARARALIGFGIHVSLGSLLWFVYSNADFAVVGWLIGATELGFYALAFQLISMPAEKLTANINKVAYPAFCRLQHDRQRLREWALQLMKLLGFFGMPVMVGMLLVAEDGIVAVLTAKWLPAVLPFQLLAVSGLIKVYAAALPPLYNAIGRPDISMKYTAFCTLVFPVCFVLAGHAFGLVGICLAWTIVFPIIVAALIHVTRHLTGFSLWDVVRSQVVIVVGVLFMATVVLGVKYLTGNESRSLRLLTAIAAGAVAYPSAMLVLARPMVLALFRTPFSSAARAKAA